MENTTGGVIMQKIYIEKSTNNVSQVIKDFYEGFNQYDQNTFGDLYYMIEIEEEEKGLDSVNFAYSPDTKTFKAIEPIIYEVIEEVKDDVKTVLELQKENEQLKEELTSLKSEFDKIKELINKFTK